MSEDKDMPSIPEEPPRRIVPWFLIGTACIVVILIIFNSWLGSAITGEDSMARRGQFGDQFGAINAAFSGLAFLGLILTLWFQTKDLRLQTEALRSQIKEFKAQKDEMAKSAAAQVAANELAAKAIKATRRLFLAQDRANALSILTLLQNAHVSAVTISLKEMDLLQTLSGKQEHLDFIKTTSSEHLETLKGEVAQLNRPFVSTADTDGKES